MFVDQRKVVEWRMRLVEILASNGDPGGLFAEMGSHVGELLALANAALTIRSAYSRMRDDVGALTSMTELGGALAGSMMGLDELEAAAMRAEGIVPIHPKRA